ncbi:MAG: hypothetical protein HGGPFJEG_00966 [Ignavibacteria bacterium]|nr:hypothetical protein [Ignavibacteria bacterium]
MKNTFGLLIFVLIIVSLSLDDYVPLTEKSFPTVNKNSQIHNKLILNQNPYPLALCCNNMDPRESTGQEWYIKCSETNNIFIDSTCCVNIWAYYNYNNPPASMPCNLIFYLCPEEFQ